MPIAQGDASSYWQSRRPRGLHEASPQRLPEDAPDGPTYIRDKTPLRQGDLAAIARP
ncbi:hypothetical protein [Thermosynechococcus sp.]|uniref:hypothetical protein n=1 Tax=Thermosynechococcus sp. TaxID=2814275 RepID=UPI003918C3CA